MRKDRITIGTFARLTGSTLKTVLYYHSIGLLPEAERSEAGYRLYGPDELARMRAVQQMKSLGMGLDRIGEVMGNADSGGTLVEALESLERDLLDQRKRIDARIAAVRMAIVESGDCHGESEHMEAESFRKLRSVLGEANMEAYRAAAPDLYEQHLRVTDMVDGYRWGIEASDSTESIAAFFRDEPEAYGRALELGVRLEALETLEPDDQRIGELAVDAAEFVASHPALIALLDRDPGIEGSFAGMFDQMDAAERAPAQRRYSRLFHRMLRERARRSEGVGVASPGDGVAVQEAKQIEEGER